ncbi:U6 snRNA phosphodiesterase Usb1 [Xylaria palmicola]|nr:U6 snRNA phosphodiesterase Usb1 [Xylaria palmicola]
MRPEYTAARPSPYTHGYIEMSPVGLVDYTSDSDDTSGSGEVTVTGPRAKKQKTSSDTQAAHESSAAASELPPLPPAFHDLYASTVRVSASDDPTLHEGRKRVNPHKAGNWPTHVYIEWHPTPPERTALTTLLTALQSSLTSSPLKHGGPTTTTITSFLTSDLGAPRPLHISLSRPIVLATAQKDAFLADLESSVRAGGVGPFELMPRGVEWHRTADSARSFLVLRVGAAAEPGEPPPADGTDGPIAANPQLAALLRRANTVATAFGQPPLYSPASSHDGPRRRGESGSGGDADACVDGKFHISIAWSFAPPCAGLQRLTDEAFNNNNNNDDDISADGGTDGSGGRPPTTTTTARDAVAAMRIRVNGVKVKIGNVVTHVPLPDARRRRTGEEAGRGLFGGSL